MQLGVMITKKYVKVKRKVNQEKNIPKLSHIHLMKRTKKVQAYFSTDSIRGKRKGKRDGPV